MTTGPCATTVHESSGGPERAGAEAWTGSCPAST